MPPEPQTTNEAPTPTATEGKSLENMDLGARIEVLKQGLSTETPTGPLTDAATPPEPAPAPAKVASETPAPATDTRAARKQRLDALMAREAERVKASQERQSPPQREPNHGYVQLQNELARLRQMEAEYQQTFQDPERFFRAASAAKADPQKMAEWMRQSMSDPAALVAASTSRVEQTLEQRFQKMLEQALEPVHQRVQTFEQQWTADRYKAIEQQAATEFMAFAESNEQINPLAAAYLQAKGADAFYKRAVIAAQGLPEGCGSQAILDKLEEDLEDLQLSTPPQPAKSVAKKNGAKSPALTNRVASGRTAVDEGVDPATLPFDKRVEYVKAKYG